MQGTQIGRERRTSGAAWGMVIAIVVAIAVVAAIVWYVLTASGGGYAPSTPYQTMTPASAAPATGAPATGAPHYP